MYDLLVKNGKLVTPDRIYEALYIIFPVEAKFLTGEQRKVIFI